MRVGVERGVKFLGKLYCEVKKLESFGEIEISLFCFLESLLKKCVAQLMTFYSCHFYSQCCG